MLPDIGGVVHRGVEIGVVADRRRQQQLGLEHGHQDPVAEPVVRPIGGRILRPAAALTCRRKVGRCSRPSAMRPLREGAAHASAAVSARPVKRPSSWQAVTSRISIADRDAHAGRLVLVIAPPKDAERQVLNRESRWRRVPTRPRCPARGVVRLVHWGRSLGSEQAERGQVADRLGEGAGTEGHDPVRPRAAWMSSMPRRWPRHSMRLVSAPERARRRFLQQPPAAWASIPRAMKRGREEHVEEAEHRPPRGCPARR